MRKTIIFLIVATTFVLMFSGIAIANNGPHLGGSANLAVSGGFAQDTDACAGCHRAHTGVQLKLLSSGTSVYSFCTACHNTTGANTNVLSGVFDGTSNYTYEGHNSETDGQAAKGLNAGGFTNALPYDGLRSRGGATDVTSSAHSVDGSNQTAWGGGLTGAASPLGGTTVAMECTSCHDPHGNKNSGGTERYRILRNTVNSVDISATDIRSHEAEFGVKDYTRMDYKEGTSTFCATCHTQYVDKLGTLASDTTAYDSADTQGAVVRHRHGVDKALSLGTTGNGLTISANLNEPTEDHTQLPVESSTANLWDIADPATSVATIEETDEVVCMSCHQAHGSSASVNNTVLPSTGSSSTLLRLDNRGVCQDCHQK